MLAQSCGSAVACNDWADYAGTACSRSGSLQVLALSRRDLDFHMLVQTIQYRYQPVNRKASEICIPDP